MNDKLKKIEHQLLFGEIKKFELTEQEANEMIAYLKNDIQNIEKQLLQIKKKILKIRKQL